MLRQNCSGVCPKKRAPDCVRVSWGGAPRSHAEPVASDGSRMRRPLRLSAVSGSEGVLHAERNYRRGSADTVDGACRRRALGETVVDAGLVADTAIQCIQFGALAHAVVVAQSEVVRAGIGGASQLPGFAISKLDGIHAHLVIA